MQPQSRQLGLSGQLDTWAVEGQGAGGGGAAFHTDLGLRGPSLCSWRAPVGSEKAALSSSGRLPLPGTALGGDEWSFTSSVRGSHGVGGHVVIKTVNNCQRAALYSNGLR